MVVGDWIGTINSLVLEKNIEDWKKSIEKAKNDIQTNLKNQDKKKVEVEEQKKVVQGVEQKEKAVK